jgi:hypothetical protein
VTPRRSQADLPETTALRATTNFFIFLPARKNSESPEEENLAEKKPMARMMRRYRAKARMVRGRLFHPGYSPSSLKKM